MICFETTEEGSNETKTSCWAKQRTLYLDYTKKFLPLSEVRTAFCEQCISEQDNVQKTLSIVDALIYTKFGKIVQRKHMTMYTNTAYSMHTIPHSPGILGVGPIMIAQTSSK